MKYSTFPGERGAKVFHSQMINKSGRQYLTNRLAILLALLSRILVSCNHAFCLTCIRTWRSKDIPSSNLDDEDRTNSVTKACPNCRTPSLYVVPSSFFP